MLGGAVFPQDRHEGAKEISIIPAIRLLNALPVGVVKGRELYAEWRRASRLERTGTSRGRTRLDAPPFNQRMAAQERCLPYRPSSSA